MEVIPPPNGTVCTGLKDSPHVIDPPNGWIENVNNWPYSAAAQYSPRKEDFPSYMDNAGESPRGLHAIQVLEGKKDFTLDRLRDAAFDSFLPAFAKMLPPLIAAFDFHASWRDSPARRLAEPVGMLAWDFTMLPAAGRAYRRRWLYMGRGAGPILVQDEADPAGCSHVVRIHSHPGTAR